MPCLDAFARATGRAPSRPNSSLPMRAITAVRAPWRAQATAAFDPLPPGLMSNECGQHRLAARDRAWHARHEIGVPARDADDVAAIAPSPRRCDRCRRRAAAPPAVRIRPRSAPPAAGARAASRGASSSSRHDALEGGRQPVAAEDVEQARARAAGRAPPRARRSRVTRRCTRRGMTLAMPLTAPVLPRAPSVGRSGSLPTYTITRS